MVFSNIPHLGDTLRSKITFYWKKVNISCNFKIYIFHCWKGWGECWLYQAGICMLLNTNYLVFGNIHFLSAQIQDSDNNKLISITLMSLYGNFIAPKHSEIWQNLILKVIWHCTLRQHQSQLCFRVMSCTESVTAATTNQKQKVTWMEPQDTNSNSHARINQNVLLVWYFINLPLVCDTTPKIEAKIAHGSNFRTFVFLICCQWFFPRGKPISVQIFGPNSA